MNTRFLIVHMTTRFLIIHMTTRFQRSSGLYLGVKGIESLPQIIKSVSNKTGNKDFHDWDHFFNQRTISDLMNPMLVL